MAIAAATSFAAAAVLLLVFEPYVRRFEARTSAFVIDALDLVGADSIGAAVTFFLDDRYVGFRITAACSAALLVAPFLALGSGVAVSRRVSVPRLLSALGLITVLLFVVNQIRLLVVVLSMRAWGYEQGYERSHVLLGTAVSTLGVVAALVAFVVVLTRQPRGLRGV
ncbi:MAG: hypothetical protein ACRD0G_15055 [Acidimicrobiales bacterium]